MRRRKPDHGPLIAGLAAGAVILFLLWRHAVMSDLAGAGSETEPVCVNRAGWISCSSSSSAAHPRCDVPRMSAGGRSPLRACGPELSDIEECVL